MTKIEDLKKLLEDEWRATQTLDAQKASTEKADKWLALALYTRQNALRSVLDYVLEVLADISKPYYEKRRLGAKEEERGE